MSITSQLDSPLVTKSSVSEIWEKCLVIWMKKGTKCSLLQKTLCLKSGEVFRN